VQALEGEEHMRGKGITNVLAQNLMAVNTHTNSQRELHRNPKMCWKCQKDKSTRGGYVKAQVGFFKFVCKDCMDAKKLKETKID
jgi:hypothetical protein